MRSTASAARSPTSAPASARSPSRGDGRDLARLALHARQRVPMRGHVAPDRQQQRAGLGLDDPPAHLADELAAVAAQAVGADREAQRMVGREVQLHVARVALAQPLGPQHLHGLAEQLVVFVAEQRLPRARWRRRSARRARRPPWRRAAPRAPRAAPPRAGAGGPEGARAPRGSAHQHRRVPAEALPAPPAPSLPRPCPRPCPARGKPTQIGEGTAMGSGPESRAGPRVQADFALRSGVNGTAPCEPAPV